ncbi:MAG: hypothetical protein O9325_20020 [Roseomonas sp.]|nr:hypothetical protein [Roseomonas sp.]
MTGFAIAALVGTIALGVVVGLLFLQRARKPRLVAAHLVLALLAAGLVLAMVVTAPATAAGPHWLLPLGLIGAALAGGYFAGKLARGSRRAAQFMLFGHAVVGVAGFLVFLAWVRHV